MKPPIDRVRLSQTAKEQLIKLKRVSKISNYRNFNQNDFVH